MAAHPSPVADPVHPLLVELNRQLWQMTPTTSEPTAVAPTAPRGPAPAKRIAGVSNRLYSRLCRWWDEHPRTTTYRRDFTLVDLMCNDISRENFSRVHGVGKATLTELENVFQSAGYRLP